MRSVKDKVVLITGASEGIGRATAYAFAKEGAKIILTYRSHKTEAELAAKQCKELGAPDVLVLQLDVTDDKSIQNTVKKATAKFKKVAILINNAGTIAWKPLAQQTFQEITSQVRTNLEGLIKMTRACLPHVTDMILNISSGVGKSPHATLSTYCATKYGVRGFTQTLALELDIPVISVNPGATATKMTGFTGVPPEKVAGVILNTAKGKYGKSGGDVDVWEYV